MGRAEKLRVRFNEIPSNFTWDELVTLLSSYGFFQQNGKGSRRKFINADGLVINLHEPHPSNIVKKYMLRQIKDKLEENSI
ncbi:type II toxin-antitoxin system HicA family toxin [Pragia fontium]|uniref:type II toxin-antitoxin system HicA family toxin n=1 Tax=Pragia fontium TaxID=82985 RepID=UPI000649EE25|nr:type II toxin-antitoxin system HicA family toxin [Pragia fontium]AKJ41777.1 hexulose-6-phosphate synthase [Pragia fontium]